MYWFECRSESHGVGCGQKEMGKHVLWLLATGGVENCGVIDVFGVVRSVYTVSRWVVDAPLMGAAAVI